MSDSNGFSGEITITPPLAWSEILDGPKLRDVCLRTAETVVDSDTARTTATTAQAIIPVEARYDGRYVAADIQAIVDAYGAGHTFAGWIQMQPDLGYGESTPVRYVVIDGRVETVTPRLVWPGDESDLSADIERLKAELRDVRVNGDWVVKCVVIKSAPDQDLYVSWSDVTATPVATWTRAEAEDYGFQASRLDRADERGTSSYMNLGAWDRDIQVGMVGTLPRHRLAEYTRLVFDGLDDAAEALLDPLDLDGDEDGEDS